MSLIQDFLDKINIMCITLDVMDILVEALLEREVT